MPILNAMPYLPETLRSIEEQTYKDADILAWDAGSKDGTLEELHRWIPTRISGRVVSRPGSIGKALSEMIFETDAPLCARIDGDDVNLPGRLKRQVDFLDANPDIAVVGTQMFQINGAGEPINQSAIPLPGSHEKILFSLLCRNPFGHSAILFRRQAVIDSGNYHDVTPVEDYDLWFRMAIKGYKLHNLPDYLVKRRVYEASVTQRSIQSGRQRGIADACVLRHAPQLYGCSVEDVRKLRERTHLVGAIPIAGFLLRFARSRNQNPVELLTDPAVLTGFYSLITAKDYASRALFKAISVVAHAVS
jgi:amylovoran biosynthesis glycosyltransferase AmsE